MSLFFFSSLDRIKGALGNPFVNCGGDVKVDGKEVEGMIQSDEVVCTLFRTELQSTTVERGDCAAIPHSEVIASRVSSGGMKSSIV